MHGHTWQVTAWWPSDGTDALLRQKELAHAVARLDHKELPDELSRGEALAAHFGHALGCVAVDVSRPLERIYARWEA